MGYWCKLSYFGVGIGINCFCICLMFKGDMFNVNVNLFYNIIGLGFIYVG